MSEAREKREPAGKLGVLMPGTTASIVAVEPVVKGLGEQVDSLITQFGLARHE